jgi:hypothetical protein
MATSIEPLLSDVIHKLKGVPENCSPAKGIRAEHAGFAGKAKKSPRLASFRAKDHEYG